LIVPAVVFHPPPRVVMLGGGVVVARQAKRYVYVGADPINLIDPTGTSCIGDALEVTGRCPQPQSSVELHRPVWELWPAVAL